MFPGQLGQLTYSTPNRVAGQAFGVENVQLFGGRDWSDVARDLAGIPPSDRMRFVLALFAIVLTDQALYTNSGDDYERWRRQTAFPKFGWTGFGVHHENPFRLLWAPERDGLVDAGELTAAMRGFVDFLFAETAHAISAYGLQLNLEAHFAGILRDPAYQFSEGRALPAFKAQFEKRLRTSADY